MWQRGSEEIKNGAHHLMRAKCPEGRRLLPFRPLPQLALKFGVLEPFEDGLGVFPLLRRALRGQVKVNKVWLGAESFCDGVGVQVYNHLTSTLFSCQYLYIHNLLQIARVGNSQPFGGE